MTIAEISYLSNAYRRRESLADLYAARIVAMLSAVNTKHHRYEPVRWMVDGQEIMRRRQEAAVARRPLTGDEALQRFRMLGVPIIDLRAKKD